MGLGFQKGKAVGICFFYHDHVLVLLLNGRAMPYSDPDFVAVESGL